MVLFDGILAPMDTEKEYISQEKYSALQAELAELTSVGRKKILSELEYAKSLGDLSENAEYHAARESQARLEERVAKIEHVLKNSIVVEKSGESDRIDVGSKAVVVKKETGEERQYEIVGAEESDMLQGKISNRSPLGEAMIGRKIGDEFSIETPKGSVIYSIKSIS